MLWLILINSRKRPSQWKSKWWEWKMLLASTKLTFLPGVHLCRYSSKTETFHKRTTRISKQQRSATLDEEAEMVGLKRTSEPESNPIIFWNKVVLIHDLEWQVYLQGSKVLQRMERLVASFLLFFALTNISYDRFQFSLKNSVESSYSQDCAYNSNFCWELFWQYWSISVCSFGCFNFFEYFIDKARVSGTFLGESQMNPTCWNAGEATCGTW